MFGCAARFHVLHLVSHTTIIVILFIAAIIHTTIIVIIFIATIILPTSLWPDCQDHATIARLHL
jgi:hypothetical protein